MSTRFVNIDRSTPMLMPPDMRDWVPEDDLVHFILAAVEPLPCSAFVVNQRGTGSAQYPPQMLLALLIYCCANGIFATPCPAWPGSAASRSAWYCPGAGFFMVPCPAGFVHPL